MLPAEARWIARVVSELNIPEFRRRCRVLNLGSSTLKFRTVTQPHIDSIALNSFRERNCEIINVDLKPDTGVDVVADLLCQEGFERLKSLEADFVLCSNMLEHVVDPVLIAARISSLVRNGAFVIVTVPRSFPYHADPIDNRFRPAPSELARLFPLHDMIFGEEVAGSTYFETLAEEPGIIPRRIARTLLPLPNYKGWLGAIDCLKWSFRRYSATCLLLKKAL